MTTSVADPAAVAEPADARAALTLALRSYRVRIASDRPQIVDAVASLYPDSLAPSEHPPAGAPELRVVAGVRADQPGYWLLWDDDPVGFASGQAEAIGRAEYILNRAFAASLGDQVLVHAGVVGAEGGALLFPGPSGRGKSTLVAGLCLAGFGYLSDELAVIDPDTHRVAPFPKAICLKEGGWRALASSGPIRLPWIEVPNTPNGDVHYLSARISRSPTDPPPIRHIVVPLREPGSPTTLSPISRAQTLACLAENSLNLPRHGERGVAALAHVVEAADCYALTYGDVAAAVTTISTLVGHRRGTGAYFNGIHGPECALRPLGPSAHDNR